MNAIGHTRQRSPAEGNSLFPQPHIIALWVLALAWIVTTSIIVKDVRIGLFGITAELLAIVVCTHLTWYIRHDHDEHARQCKASIPRIEIQPTMDLAGAFRAGWITRDLEQHEAESGLLLEDGKVYSFDKHRAERLDRQLSLMRRPTAPVPPQRQNHSGTA